MNTLGTAEIETRLRAILSDLLLLKTEDVRSESLLIDDLDVDSIALLELAFTIERDFGVPFPDVKASEETFSALLPDALQKLEATPGGTTFFEYVKEEAIREMLTRTETVAELAAVLAIPVAPGLRADGALATTRIRELWQAGLLSPHEADGQLLDRPFGEAVVMHYLRNEVAERETCEQAHARGGSAEAIPADVGDPNGVRELFARIRVRWPRLDCLVHGAAMGRLQPLLAVRPAEWNVALRTNAQGLLLLTREAVGLLGEPGGRIVALSSLGSQRYVPFYGAIGASKAALESIVRYLAVELAPRGIHVNAVSGGMIDGDTLR